MSARRLFVPKRFPIGGKARSLDDRVRACLAGRFCEELRNEFSGRCLEMSAVVAAVLEEEGFRPDLIAGLMTIDAKTGDDARFVLNHAWVQVEESVIDLAFPDVIAYYKPGETLPALNAQGRVIDLEVPAAWVPPAPAPVVGEPPQGVAYRPQQRMYFPRVLEQPWGARRVRDVAKKFRLRFRKLLGAPGAPTETEEGQPKQGLQPKEAGS